jgi:biotin-(acetyl-CoA carboxylase) ligase
MPLASRSRIAGPGSRALDLPPPFRLVVLREVGDAFAHACSHAAEFGAGTLVFVGRFDLAEFAVVLEPDEPLATARLAFYAGMVALADALAACAPPEKPIAVEWPDAIQVDRGLVGGGRLAWPVDTAETAVPDWLAFGAMIRTVSLPNAEAGLYPLATALAAEGFGEASAERLTEGFARHLMVAVDRWRELGFASVAREYLAMLATDGAHCRLGNNGDLLIGDTGAAVESRSLLSALRLPSWLDPATGAPSLGPRVLAPGAGSK